MPQFDLSTWPSQIFWLVLCFVTLYLVVARVVLPRLEKTLDMRASEVMSQRADAARASREAEEANREALQLLAQARAEAQSVTREARARLEEELLESKRALEREVSQLLTDNEERIRVLQEEARVAAHGAAREVAGEIVKAFTGKAPTKAAVEQAVKEAVRS